MTTPLPRDNELHLPPCLSTDDVQPPRPAAPHRPSNDGLNFASMASSAATSWYRRSSERNRDSTSPATYLCNVISGKKINPGSRLSDKSRGLSIHKVNGWSRSSLLLPSFDWRNLLGPF